MLNEFSTFLSQYDEHLTQLEKDICTAKEAAADVSLEFSCYFYHPVDAGNLISGSSAFSKSSLNTWKFLVHILLKPSLENFEHDLASM